MDARGKISPNDPAMCRYVPHDFPHPYFVPVMPDYSRMKVNDGNAPAALGPINARATLECRRCGFRRIINYSGKVLTEGHTDAELQSRLNAASPPPKPAA